MDPRKERISPPLVWAGGLILSLISPTFYRRASHQPLGVALGFFVLFGLTLTTLQTISTGAQLGGYAQLVEEEVGGAHLPALTISDGQAVVEAEEPVILTEGGETFLAVDTTGRTTTIDADDYTFGLLVTAEELHLLTENGLQTIALSDLHSLFGDPIMIEAQPAAAYIEGITTRVTVGFLAAAAGWHLLVRAIYIGLVALMYRTILILINQTVPFPQILSMAIYAVVPAWLAAFLLRESGFGPPLVFTVIYLGVLAVMLQTENPNAPDLLHELRHPRMWRTLIGLPLLALIAVHIVTGAAPPAALWGFSVGTVAVLAATSWFTRTYQPDEETN